LDPKRFSSHGFPMYVSPQVRFASNSSSADIRGNVTLKSPDTLTHGSPQHGGGCEREAVEWQTF